MTWYTPKTNWTAADGVANTDFNRIEGNILEVRNDLQSNYLMRNAFGTTAGTGAAYTLAFSPALASYEVGLQVTFKAHIDCTGACTLNINSRGAKPIVSFYGKVLYKKDLEAGCIYNAVYDGSSFRVKEIHTNSNSGTALLKGFTTDVSVDWEYSTDKYGLGHLYCFLGFFTYAGMLADSAMYITGLPFSFRSPGSNIFIPLGESSFYFSETTIAKNFTAIGMIADGNILRFVYYYKKDPSGNMPTVNMQPMKSIDLGSNSGLGFNLRFDCKIQWD